VRGRTDGLGTGSKLDSMATEESAARSESDEPPELLVKLRERKERHKQRHILYRIAVVLVGVLIVLAGIAMSAPGVPGPGIATILIGLGFLALEFDRAERVMEKVIIWGDQVKDRAEETSRTQRIVATFLTVVAVAGFVFAAVLWDIPLLPVL
jgi:uncharacterized protein (TIGR02611 family)